MLIRCKRNGGWRALTGKKYIDNGLWRCKLADTGYNLQTMKLIDTHVHFWDPDRLRYPWLDDLAALKRPFLPTDYAQAATGFKVEGVVFVQADCLPEQGLAEVDWAAALEVPLMGIVAFAPLTMGDAVAPYLTQLQARPLVKGVRRLIQAEAADFARQPAFVRGVQLLAAYGLPFDICIKYQQLPAVIELVNQCPQVKFVLDHIGKPDIAGEELAVWQQHIRLLAAHDNVFCKLSGVITEADWDSWTAAGIRPYLDHVLAAFGLDRVMFGSDWPVVNLAGSWAAWMTVLSKVTADFSEGEKEKLFNGNGRRFYGL